MVQARVTVVQSLPLLEPRLHAPPPTLIPPAQSDSSSSAIVTPEGTPKSSATAAAPPAKGEGAKPLPMAALKGQMLQWAMLLSNAGETYAIISIATVIITSFQHQTDSRCSLYAVALPCL